MLLAIVSACAAAGAKHTSRPGWIDPWTYSNVQHARIGEPIRCTKTPVPVCASKPMPAELTPIDVGLPAKVGQIVTVASEVTTALRCTLRACYSNGVPICCNGCGGTVELCAGDPDCRARIVVGSCAGDECTTCCTIAVHEHRVMVARGLLEWQDLDGHAVLSLVDAEYCYLQ
jgi:hypothetical protein